MILAVDIGNSATKFALIRNARIVRRDIVSADASDRAIARALARLVRNTPVLDAAALSSVRPRATEAVVRAIVRATGLYPIVVNHRTSMPISIDVRQPERVGVDRLCAACGAITGRRRNAIVVTIGSAITVNLVRDRVFLGGVIMPGPAMALDSMHAFTAQLPKVAFAATPPPRFDDTVSAMQWGAHLAGAGGIRAAVERLDRLASRPVTRFVTGGYAPGLRSLLPGAWHYQPDLVLLGLAQISRVRS